MDLRQIRAQARTIQLSAAGMTFLFFIPVLAMITSSFAFSNGDLREQIATMKIEKLFFYTIERQIFPTIVRFIISIFFISAIFTLIEIVRQKRTKTKMADSFRAFSSENFKQVFLLSLTKKILLLIWNSVTWAGIMMSYYASFKILAIVNKETGGQAVTALSENTQNLILDISPMLFLGLLLMIVGFAIALPQYYAYSQAEYILYDKLASKHVANPLKILRESRQLVKGYKSKRFLLDLSFIGWHILVSLTFGLAAFFVYPYIYTAETVFYEQLKKRKSQVPTDN